MFVYVHLIKGMIGIFDFSLVDVPGDRERALVFPHCRQHKVDFLDRHLPTSAEFLQRPLACFVDDALEAAEIVIDFRAEHRFALDAHSSVEGHPDIDTRKASLQEAAARASLIRLLFASPNAYDGPGAGRIHQ
jgi:hypothetical protein